MLPWLERHAAPLAVLHPPLRAPLRPRLSPPSAMSMHACPNLSQAAPAAFDVSIPSSSLRRSRASPYCSTVAKANTTNSTPVQLAPSMEVYLWWCGCPLCHSGEYHVRIRSPEPERRDPCIAPLQIHTLLEAAVACPVLAQDMA
eukprot:3937456-Rhodomonas_salina.1